MKLVINFLSVMGVLAWCVASASTVPFACGTETFMSNSPERAGKSKWMGARFCGVSAHGEYQAYVASDVDRWSFQAGAASSGQLKWEIWIEPSGATFSYADCNPEIANDCSVQWNFPLTTDRTFITMSDYSSTENVMEDPRVMYFTRDGMTFKLWTRDLQKITLQRGFLKR